MMFYALFEQQDKGSTSAYSWDTVVDVATMLSLQLQSKRRHLEFAWHHLVMAAFLGKLVKRWLI